MLMNIYKKYVCVSFIIINMLDKKLYGRANNPILINAMFFQ